MPPGLGRMHRIDDACAGYELDLAAPGAYIMIAVELHIYPHNAGTVGGEARSLPPLFFDLFARRTAIAMGGLCNAARRPRISQDFTTTTGRRHLAPPPFSFLPGVAQG